MSWQSPPERTEANFEETYDSSREIEGRTNFRDTRPFRTTRSNCRTERISKWQNRNRRNQTHHHLVSLTLKGEPESRNITHFWMPASASMTMET
jgi:hypothetical protein